MSSHQLHFYYKSKKYRFWRGEAVGRNLTITMDLCITCSLLQAKQSNRAYYPLNIFSLSQLFIFLSFKFVGRFNQRNTVLVRPETSCNILEGVELTLFLTSKPLQIHEFGYSRVHFSSGSTWCFLVLGWRHCFQNCIVSTGQYEI